MIDLELHELSRLSGKLVCVAFSWFVLLCLLQISQDLSLPFRFSYDLSNYYCCELPTNSNLLSFLNPEMLSTSILQEVRPPVLS